MVLCLSLKPYFSFNDFFFVCLFFLYLYYEKQISLFNIIFQDMKVFHKPIRTLIKNRQEYKLIFKNGMQPHNTPKPTLSGSQHLNTSSNVFHMKEETLLPEYIKSEQNSFVSHPAPQLQNFPSTGTF